MIIANQNYYKFSRPLKEHEKALGKIIIKNYKKKKMINIIDLGCADGKFLRFLDTKLNFDKIIGIDFDKKLVNEAKKIKFNGNSNFICENFVKFNQNLKNFDIIIASGFYNLFSDPIKYLNKSLKYLSKEGNIFIFQRVNLYPIDTRYFIRTPGTKKWSSERILYHYKYFLKYLPKNKVKKAKKWNINIDIKKTNNPFSTYVIKTKKNQRYQLSNSNIVNEQFFLWTENKKKPKLL
jgi:2-polyprenyl-3-methyl-5-hydroxy-6-metoxy-1,4-benzoquinol methylase